MKNSNYQSLNKKIFVIKLILIILNYYSSYNWRPVEVKKILGGDWEFMKKCWHTRLADQEDRSTEVI